MQQYDFSSNYLRSGMYGIYPDHRKICNPITATLLNITILVGEQNLHNLVKLIPHVINLNLIFCDLNVRYDLGPLINLRNLRELQIKGIFGRKIRLFNISNLSILNLDILTLYGKDLNPTDPVYQWPKVRNSYYKHINNIKTYPNVIIYDIDVSNLNIDKTNITDNIILQKINEKYFMISTYGKAHHGSDLLIKPIEVKQFLSIINLQKINCEEPWCESVLDIPLIDDDLYENDTDTD